MRNWLIAVLLVSCAAAGAHAQNPESACFPNCVEQDIGVDVNSIKTSLDAPIPDTVSTTAIVDNGAGIPDNAACWINDGTGEQFRVVSRSGNTLTIERGYDGSPKAPHTDLSEDTAPFYCGAVAKHHNQLAANFLVVQGNILLCTSVSELTIAAGGVTIPHSGCFSVDTEADAASDDLELITCAAGVRFLLYAENGGRTVVVKKVPGVIEHVADFQLNSVFDSWEGWCRQANVAIRTGGRNGG